MAFVVLPTLSNSGRRTGTVGARCRRTIQAVNSAVSNSASTGPEQSVFRAAADGFYDRVRMVAAEDVNPESFQAEEGFSGFQSRDGDSEASPLACVANTIVLYRRDLRAKHHCGLSIGFKNSSEATLPLFIASQSEIEMLSKNEGVQLVSALQELKRSLEEMGSGLAVCTLPRGSESQAEFLAKTARMSGARRVVLEEDYTEQLLELQRALGQVDPSLELTTWTSNTQKDVDEAGPETYKEWKASTKAVSLKVGEENVSKDIVRALPSASPAGDEGWQSTIEAWAGLGQNEDLEQRLVEDQDACYCVPTRLPIGEDSAERVLVEALEKAESYQKVDIIRSLVPYTRLGCLSPRRAREIVANYERRHARLIGAVQREAAKRTLSALDGLEWHNTLAARDRAVEEDWRYWKFNGWLSRYKISGDSTKPAVVFVHGFGASSSHWDSNIKELQENYEVWALDLVGFGRSQKPPMQYTQALWEANVASFVRRIVQRPVFIAGNSIGGYLTTAFASDFPELCNGAMLLNSAGRLFEPEENEELLRNPPKPKQTAFQFFMKEYRFVRMGAAGVLFGYLQGNIEKTLRRVYPNKQPGTLKKLALDIYRDSSDPGANDVLASGFVLPPPRSLNDLLEKYEGPLLILQGQNDPLNDAKGRAERLKRVYPRADLQLIEAGHCPHHEDPETVNGIMKTWIGNVLEGVENKRLSVKEVSTV